MNKLVNPKFKLDNAYIQIYMGEGKGKSTASLGLMLRHLGHGGRVLYMQFCKGDTNFISGEKKFIEKMGNLFRSEILFLNLDIGDKWENASNITEKDKENVLKIYRTALSFMNAYTFPYTLIILDEVGYAIEAGLIEEQLIVDLINKYSGKKEIVLTGRHFSNRIKDMAHLITDMQCIKHYYDLGVKARLGIDY